MLIMFRLIMNIYTGWLLALIMIILSLGIVVATIVPLCSGL